jgi:hypothetical protein
MPPNESGNPPCKGGSPSPIIESSLEEYHGHQRRQTELLWFVVRGLTELGDKLDDLSALNQQQTDLLRRLVVRNERTP